MSAPHGSRVKRSLDLRVVVLLAVTSVTVTPARAARTFDLATASIADINAAFNAGALTSERLTTLYLARIAAYDKAGPRLNSVFHLNPTAIDDARALDAERRAKGRRTPLHGLPVLLKANIDVAVGRRQPGSMRFAIRVPRSMRARPRASAVRAASFSASPT